MSELVLKYELLNDFGKQELLDFLNFLLTKRSRTQPQRDQPPAKSVGNLLALLGNFTDVEFADNLESQKL